MSIGKTIYSLRKQNGLTQEQLAERINVSRQTVAKWEAEKGTPDIESLKIMADIFNADLNELAGYGSSGLKKADSINMAIVQQKIFILDSNGNHLVACDKFGVSEICGANSDKDADVIGEKQKAKAKVPSYILYGVDKRILGIMDHKVTLGFYKEKDDAKKELEEILAAVKAGQGTYTLKYSVVMDGVRIYEGNN